MLQWTDLEEAVQMLQTISAKLSQKLSRGNAFTMPTLVTLMLWLSNDWKDLPLNPQYHISSSDADDWGYS